MLRKDNIAFGVLIGLVMPALFYGVLYLISLAVETGSSWTRPFEKDRMLLLALVINVFPLRMYFVNYQSDKTGRGILLATFVLMVAYFMFIRYF